MPHLLKLSDIFHQSNLSEQTNLPPILQHERSAATIKLVNLRLRFTWTGAHREGYERWTNVPQRSALWAEVEESRPRLAPSPCIAPEALQ